MTPDSRFPDWEPDEKTKKSTILYHMSYAHEKEAKEEGIEWWGSNIQYWLRKYTREQLLEIHQKYHKQMKPEHCPYTEEAFKHITICFMDCGSNKTCPKYHLNLKKN